jgi:SAM-dependent methyltransferase
LASRHGRSAAFDAAGFELRGRPLACAQLVDTAGKNLLNIGCTFGWYERLALADAARVLRPGGTLALSTPNASLSSMIADPAWYVGHRHYRVATIERLLAGASFECRSLRVAGGFCDLADILLYYAWRRAAHRAAHPFEAIRRRADAEWRLPRGRNVILAVATATET